MEAAFPKSTPSLVPLSPVLSDGLLVTPDRRQSKRQYY